MKEDQLVVLIVVGFVGLIGFIIWLAWYFQKRRREAWQFLADKLGLAYLRENASILMQFSGFKIFGLGRARRAFNVVSGKFRSAELVLTDYQYVTGSGKNRHTHSQTLCIVKSDRLQLPHSFLRKQMAIFDYLGKLFGGQDINFPEDADFSNAFVLQGHNESATQALFGPDVRAYFLRFKGARLQFECSGNTLLLHHGRRLSIAQVEELIERSFEMVNLLRR